MQAVTGQKIHEAQYGARLKIFGKTIPCAHSKLEKNFSLVPGGQSPLNFVGSITFRRELLAAADFPKKGVPVELQADETADWLPLKLWEGGLLTGRDIYEFMAVDPNYNA